MWKVCMSRRGAALTGERGGVRAYGRGDSRIERGGCAGERGEWGRP